jgi:O-antigen/teichoic acid export membrane protein
MSLSAKLTNGSLKARVMRSSLLIVGGFGFSQMLRLGSNLILTRMLFPEAFGLMALVTVFLVGLTQLSDMGVVPAVLQSKRGDDPEFLDTAWSLQALRGFALWLLACALAWPMGLIYNEPQLTEILPVAALSLFITGFRPTRAITANRHLMLGRVTLLDVTTQIVGVISAIVLVWWWGSVWALVASGVIGAAAEVLLSSHFLPGHRNSFRLEAKARRELIKFGKWVFLATVCGFFITQADKMLIGKYLSLSDFGLYNIGYFWAAFPLMMGTMVTQKILIPIYRETPPRQSRENFIKLRKMRFAVSGLLLGFVWVLALIGAPLVEHLYDARYMQAGGIVVAVTCAQIPMLIVLTYDHAALAAGDSRRFFVLAAVRAALIVGCIALGLQLAGLVGAIIGIGAAGVLAYPVVVWLARHMGAGDGLHDLVMALFGLAIILSMFWVNNDALQILSEIGN